jgi:hypothetical protein
LLEDIALLLGVFAATTAFAIAYALSRKPVAVSENVVKQFVVLQPGDLPEQTNTRLSPVVLEAEQRVRSLEERAFRILRELESEDDGGQGSGS